MSSKPNNVIKTPQHLHIKVQITLDPNTHESAMTIMNGKINNVQLAALLMEHATNILRQMMAMQTPLPPINPFEVPPTGGNNNAA